MENLKGAVSVMKENFHGSVIVCSKLYNLLSSVKEIKLVTNVKEILDGLKMYIQSKELFDPQNQSRICCQNDELGAVFGVSEFTIYEVPKLLRKFVFPAHSDAASSSTSFACSKRKSEEMDISVMKKTRNDSMVLYLPPSPAINNLSSSEESLQGYETATVKDTSDDSFCVSHVESDGADDNFSIVTVEETFDIEYEVESLSSSPSSDSCSSQSESDSEMDAFQSTIINLICKSDSDMEFWADKSSDEDFFSFNSVVSDADKSDCSACEGANYSANVKCEKCFHRQLEWFASEKRTRPKRKNRARRKRASQLKNNFKEEPSKPSQSDDVSSSSSNNPSSSQESGYYSECATGTLTQSDDLRRDSDAKMCFLCCERPANGTIIHAHSKYAHTISCYPCAKKLQHQKKRCPICRRRIHRVVCLVSS